MEGRKGRKTPGKWDTEESRYEGIQKNCMDDGKRATMIHNDFAKLPISCHKILLSKLVQIPLDVNTVTWTETWSTSSEVRMMRASSNMKLRDEAYGQILPRSEVLGAWILWQVPQNWILKIHWKKWMAIADLEEGAKGQWENRANIT